MKNYINLDKALLNKTIKQYGLYAVTIFSLLSCNPKEKENRGKEKIAQLAPKHNDGGTMIDAGDGSIAIEHNDSPITSSQIIKIDTTIEDSASNTSLIDASYSKEELRRIEYVTAVGEKPKTSRDVSNNPDVLGEQITNYADDLKTLMIIARSSNCNTTLLERIGSILNKRNFITPELQSELKKLFNERITMEISSKEDGDSTVSNLIYELKKNSFDKSIAQNQ